MMIFCATEESCTSSNGDKRKTLQRKLKLGWLNAKSLHILPAVQTRYDVLNLLRR